MLLNYAGTSLGQYLLNIDSMKPIIFGDEGFMLLFLKNIIEKYNSSSGELLDTSYYNDSFTDYTSYMINYKNRVLLALISIRGEPPATFPSDVTLASFDSTNISNIRYYHSKFNDGTKFYAGGRTYYPAFINEHQFILPVISGRHWIEGVYARIYNYETLEFTECGLLNFYAELLNVVQQSDSEFMMTYLLNGSIYAQQYSIQNISLFPQLIRRFFYLPDTLYINLTSANLYATNSNNSPKDIVYFVSGLRSAFQRDGIYVTSFTQEEVNQGRIQLFGDITDCGQLFSLFISDAGGCILSDPMPTLIACSKASDSNHLKLWKWELLAGVLLWLVFGNF